MPHLLLVTIGPVQEFIAAARRTRDLWFGSWLLSELAKTVAQALQTHGKLIFPFPNPENSTKDLAPNSQFNCPNKILVHITTDDVKAIADAAYTALCGRLHGIRDGAFEKIAGKFKNDIAEQQINDLIEFMWVALPFPDGANYADTRKKLEALMAARKNTRNFREVQWGSNTPKSSIDGLRESVIPEGEFDTLSPVQLFTAYGNRPGERMSGVDLLKRHGFIPDDSDQTHFLSTSHIAALPFITRLEKVDTKIFRRAWATYLRSLSPAIRKAERLSHKKSQSLLGYYDGSLLFTERLGDSLKDVRKSKTPKSSDSTPLRAAQKALETFFQQIKEKQRPIPYYAILHADGDSMGVVIDHQAQYGLEKHRDISKQLAKFAHKVRDIVTDHQGALIYAGGDDVLALVPLHTVLACAKELAETFEKTLKLFTNKDGVTPTLSVGVAIVHHLEPLSDALELARAAEAAAKSIVGKNALAIILSKRGGADRTVKGSWKQSFFERLTRFIELHFNNHIPDGAAYELQDLALRFDLSQAPDDKARQTWVGIRHKEALRILKRKRTNEKEVDPEIIKWLEKSITGDNIGEIAKELIIASLFAQAKQLSEGEPT